MTSAKPYTTEANLTFFQSMEDRLVFFFKGVLEGKLETKAFHIVLNRDAIMKIPDLVARLGTRQDNFVHL